jgi:ketosteroid isomerase-like protein
MSQGNVEQVRRTVDGWNRDDLDLVLETLDPEVEFHTSGVFPDFDAVYRGREGYARFWRAMHEPWEELRLYIERIEEGDDCVVLEFRFRAKGTGSGAHVDLKFANAITLRDGLQTKIVARRVFEEALTAAGLSG